MGRSTRCHLVLASFLMFVGVAWTAHCETPVERGGYLVNGIGSCGNCHSPQEADGSLTGPPLSGGPAITSPSFVAYPPNLTADPVTGIGGWTVAQIVTALREGRTPDGTLLRPPMPIALYRGMSDRDAEAIATYLKQVPAVSNKVPVATYRGPVPTSYGPPIQSVPDPDPADKVATGRYLVQLGHCMLCHTPLNADHKPDYANRLGAGGFTLSGIFGERVSPNITPDKETGIGAWSDGDIRTALTTGITPTGAVLASPMPWHYLARVNGADIDAIIAYLRSITAIRHRID